MCLHLCEHVCVSALYVHEGTCVSTCVCPYACAGGHLLFPDCSVQETCFTPSLGLALPPLPRIPVAGCAPLTHAACVVFKEILGARTWDRSRFFPLLCS